MLFDQTTTASFDVDVQKGIEPDMHPYGACYHDLAEQQSTGVIEFLKCNGIDTVLVRGGWPPISAPT